MEEYKQFLSGVILNLLKSGMYIYIPTQAFVYLAGRMLGILSAYWTRNLLAFILITIFSYGYVSMNIDYLGTKELIWICSQWVSMGILWYVLLGFRLFGRVDNLLDDKFAKDKKKRRK